MTEMSSIADVTIAAATEMSRFEDGCINIREVLRQLAESVVNEIMSAEADQPCEAVLAPGDFSHKGLRWAIWTKIRVKRYRTPRRSRLQPAPSYRPPAPAPSPARV